MYNNKYNFRIKVVRHYLERSDSLRKTADLYGVSYRTVYKWVKWYRDGGIERLSATYKRPWNRSTETIEKAVIRMKEQQPCLTARKAGQLLLETGITISHKTVWEIWRRYGFTGFRKESATARFIDYGYNSPESRNKLQQATILFNNGKKKRAAKILNTIPFLPRNDLISKLGDQLLNSRRRIEKAAHMFGHIPLARYMKKTARFSRELIRSGEYFSGVRVGIMNIVASTWHIDPEKELQKIARLKQLLKSSGHERSYLINIPLFQILIAEGIACSFQMDLKRGRRIAGICRRLLAQKKNPSPYFMGYLATLYTYLEEYNKAAYLIVQSYGKVTPAQQKTLVADLIKSFVRSGRYDQALKLFSDKGFTETYGGQSGYLRTQAILSLMNGIPRQALEQAIRSLDVSQAGQLTLYMYYTSFLIACVYCALGERQKGITVLRRMVPYLKKHGLHREIILCKIYMQKRSKQEKRHLRLRNILPRHRLALLLKYGDFDKAYHVASQKGMLSYLHRDILFFPKTVFEKFNKPRRIPIPKSLLRLPVFSVDRPGYYISFLGDLKIHCRGRFLDIHLSPKDSAFIIHLALKAGEPGTHFSLGDLYDNFWKQSKHPARNLSHMLVRIRKKLRFATNLLEISHREGIDRCVNSGLYFLTDYHNYLQTTTQARLFKREGEFEFARQYYRRAFILVRGKPFKKMFDRWSDTMRTAIRNRIEQDVLRCRRFAEGQNYRKLVELCGTVSDRLGV